MARDTQPKCKQCRREGQKLFLKGERCYTDKCPVEKRKTAPGQHGAQRRKLSNYGIQLREKQKLKRIYSVLERQFKNFFKKALISKGKTGENLLKRLELRLDSIVYKLSFAPSRSAARQLVRHNHVYVNGKRCNIPSCLLKVGDKVEISQRSRTIASLLASMEISKRDGHTLPSWLKADFPNFSGTVLSLPERSDIQIPVKEQLVVELYSNKV